MPTSPDVKTAILVAINGITCDSLHDAKFLIREYRQIGKYILVLEKEDLERIINGESLLKILEEKYDKLLMI